MSLVTELRVASGKTYWVDDDGFVPGARQYVDRDYIFDTIPEIARGATHIRTAGNDKMIPETAPCLSFVVTEPVTVMIVYADKLRGPLGSTPCWLADFGDTREKVTRTDSNPSTLKGIFTLFTRDFEPGRVELWGNLAAAMAADPAFVASGPLGTNYCMYSVVVKRRSIAGA